MDAAIIATYCCNTRCRACDTWAHPTRQPEEFAPDLLHRLPDGMGRVNITGGEPLIRRDLPQIVDILAPKAERLEISTNGWSVSRLAAIGSAHPENTIRVARPVDRCKTACRPIGQRAAKAGWPVVSPAGPAARAALSS